MHNIRLLHIIEDEAEEKEVENPSFLLTNKKGGYLSLASCSNISRFQGCYFLKQLNEKKAVMYKVIESLQLDDVPAQIINNFFCITRRYGKASEQFTQFYNNAFLYSVQNYTGDILLTLDTREIYDYDDQGRIYSINKINENVIIEYIKYKDNSLKNTIYKVCLVIKSCDERNSPIEYELVNKWSKKEYEYDKKRNSQPNELFIYDAIKLKIKKNTRLVFSYNDSKQEAIDTANNVALNQLTLSRLKQEYTKTLVTHNINLRNSEVSLAYKNCINSLDQLSTELSSNESNNKTKKTNNKGIFAGLPWFFQFWTRDENIALIGLIKEERFSEAKSILFRMLENILPDGRLANRFPKAELGCADSIGLLFKRISDLMEETKKKKQFQQYFSDNDIQCIKDALLRSLIKNEKYHTKSGLTHNLKLETWMDTTIDNTSNDAREGERIEIQAARLFMIKFMIELSNITNDNKKAKEYAKIEQEFTKKVKDIFFAEKYILKDGKNDATIRPNIFLAHYLYPELLSQQEWEEVFDTALKQLWVDWGGLTTIDKTSKYFTWEHTGENNKSYHRGDSWFFLNNIAAICLHRINKTKYDYAIRKIVDASTQDILWNGFIGHASELSSAKEQRAEGCLAQAWSAGTYIELVQEIYGK
ncbi:hypothetical protein HZA96_03615 [Candidatus Woesearchaeota archaeon]|nr:hypothetical protein [Candidatus Woesearchaeota archaeon]